MNFYVFLANDFFLHYFWHGIGVVAKIPRPEKALASEGHFGNTVENFGNITSAGNRNIQELWGHHGLIRAVAGQHSSPDLCFATTSVKIYDP